MPGNFTVGMALQILPFTTNKVSLVDLNGSLLVETLEDAIAQSISVIPIKDSVSLAYPHSAGPRYDVNLTAPYGSRVSQVEVNSGLVLCLHWDGVPLISWRTIEWRPLVSWPMVVTTILLMFQRRIWKQQKWE